MEGILDGGMRRIGREVEERQRGEGGGGGQPESTRARVLLTASALMYNVPLTATYCLPVSLTCVQHCIIYSTHNYLFSSSLGPFSLSPVLLCSFARPCTVRGVTAGCGNQRADGPATLDVNSPYSSIGRALYTQLSLVVAETAQKRTER